MTRERLMYAGIATALVLAAFARSFGMYPFYDHWMYLSAVGPALAHHAPGEFIWSAYPPHWSPLSFAWWIFNLRFVGWESDVLIRSTNALLVWCGLIVFAASARGLGASRGAIVAGMAVLGLHHINAAPDFSYVCNDQIAADLLTWLIVGVTIATRGVPRPKAARQMTLVVTLLVPALLIKEQALAAVAAIAVLAVWSTFVDREEAWMRRLRWKAVAGAVAVSAAFAAARAAAGLWFAASGPYRFCPTCIPGNVGLLLTSLVVPSRTLDVFLAVRTWPPQMNVVMPVLFGTSAVLAGLVGGLISRGPGSDRKTVGLCAVLLVSSGFPVVLQRNVTELYAHTALFWFAMLVAMAVDGWRARLRDTPVAARTAFVVAPVIYALSLAIGLSGNLREMRETGERSRMWRERIHALVRNVPPGSVVLARGVPMVKGPNDYGLYRVTTPGYLLAGTLGLAWRAPVDLTWCVEGDGCAPPDYVLEIDANERVRLRRPGRVTGSGAAR